MFKSKLLLLVVVTIILSLANICHTSESEAAANWEKLRPVRELLQSRIDALDNRGLKKEYEQFMEKKAQLEQEYQTYIDENLYKLAVSFYKKEALHSLIKIYEIDYPLSPSNDVSHN